MKLNITTILIIISLPRLSIATTTCAVKTCTSSVQEVNSPTGCSNYSSTCYYFSGTRSGTAKVYNCTSCSDGSTPISANITDGCTVTYSKCSSNDNPYPECYTLSGNTYVCAAGCYGYATGYPYLKGCKPCIANATCQGGNGYGPVCKDGYYLHSDECKACVPNATCKNNHIECDAGYYFDAYYNSCLSCYGTTGVLSPDITSRAGQTDNITKCYIPANSSISDKTGTYIFTNDCYYSK